MLEDKTICMYKAYKDKHEEPPNKAANELYNCYTCIGKAPNICPNYLNKVEHINIYKRIN